jgi:hypothetical protein
LLCVAACFLLVGRDVDGTVFICDVILEKAHWSWFCGARSFYGFRTATIGTEYRRSGQKDCRAVLECQVQGGSCAELVGNQWWGNSVGISFTSTTRPISSRIGTGSTGNLQNLLRRPRMMYYMGWRLDVVSATCCFPCWRTIRACSCTRATFHHAPSNSSRHPFHHSIKWVDACRDVL